LRYYVKMRNNLVITTHLVLTMICFHTCETNEHSKKICDTFFYFPQPQPNIQNTWDSFKVPLLTRLDFVRILFSNNLHARTDTLNGTKSLHTTARSLDFSVTYPYRINEYASLTEYEFLVQTHLSSFWSFNETICTFSTLKVCKFCRWTIFKKQNILNIERNKFLLCITLLMLKCYHKYINSI